MKELPKHPCVPTVVEFDELKLAVENLQQQVNMQNIHPIASDWMDYQHSTYIDAVAWYYSWNGLNSKSANGRRVYRQNRSWIICCKGYTAE